MNDATLRFPFERTLPQPGEAMPIAEDIFWIRMPLPFALNHINLWLLKDRAGWTIVDCGYGIAATHALWQQIFAKVTKGEPIRRVIVTHYHPDHVGCASWLAHNLDAEVWMTETEFFATHAAREGSAGFNKELAFKYFVSHGLSRERGKAQETRGNSYARGVPDMVRQYRRIIEDDQIEINGDHWRVIIGRGHAPEHAMLHCAARNLLISGDQVLPRITTNVGAWPNQPNGDPLRLFLDTMTKLEPLPRETLVLPSHDRVFSGMHARFDMLREHHAARLTELRAACDKPRTAAEIIPILFARELDDHQLVFAMGEAIAHLNYAMFRGEMERMVDDNGQFRFVATSSKG